MVYRNALAAAALTMAALLVIATGGDTEKDKEKKVKSSKVSVRVTADAIYRAYKANEVAADNKYKGKVIAVSGIVDSIGKGFTGGPYISLKTSSPILGVRCYFAKSHLGELAKIKKNTEVTLKCVGGGKIMSPILRGCLIK